MNADIDLVLERDLDAAPGAVWRCWTEPELLRRWFCPAPWRLAEVELEPRPGGRFDTVMEGPEGERHAGKGCILAIEKEKRIVFTDALEAGYRPGAQPFMTVEVTFAPAGDGGCRYRAVAMHKDAESKRRHEEMGFKDGWGAAASQLEELAKTL